MADTGVQYSLIFQNNSVNTANACVYQTDPDIGAVGVQSLAWFSKRATPTTRITFKWTVDYSFQWAETGQLVPGVIFAAGQAWPADLSTTNQITLTHVGNAYSFTSQQKGPQPGNLYITEDSSVPLNMASVGIGMSGNGTFAVQAQPNMNVIFTPHPSYWITFGVFEEGEVVDVTKMTNPAAIAFPPGVTSMSAILNPDNSWSVQPTAKMNLALVTARESDRDAVWGFVV